MSEQKTTTVSIALDDMSLDDLVHLQQGLGRQIDALREKRAYLKVKIDARLAKGERNKPPESAAEAQTISAADVAVVSAGDATAPGAEITVASAT